MSAVAAVISVHAGTPIPTGSNPVTTSAHYGADGVRDLAFCRAAAVFPGIPQELMIAHVSPVK